uniref:Uncharacterized protein n=1 Tax=Archaeoglobus fulgidus TaxID=2234 RepID=A0A7C3RCK9_ARCFL
MKKIAIPLLLVILIAPALALETLTKDNFDTPETQITPEKVFYLPGETVTAEYIILPKSEKDMKLIGGEDYDTPRIYTFETDLENPHGVYTIYYYKAGTFGDVLNFVGKKAKVNVPGLIINNELRGVEKISVNITGLTPSISSRLELINLIKISIKDAEEDALPPLTIKVVNTQKFGEDIQKVRADAASLKSDLDSAGVQYNQSDFDEISSLLSSAENFVSQGKYVEANEKITEAEEKLKEIASQADKLKAETERDHIEDILNRAYLNLSVLEIALNKVANSKNYTTYVQTYAELKSKYDSLKKQFDDADKMITDKKYSAAYEKLKAMRPDAENLLKSILELKTKIENEKPESIFPSLKLDLSLLPYIAAAVAAAVVVFAAVKLRGRRRKWDELR